MAMDKERLLELAYRLVQEPGWPDRDERSGGNTALGTVAGIFREFACRPPEEGGLVAALSLVEKLPSSPLARHSMRGQYEGILRVLYIRNGRVHHPELKNLTFEELAYVIGWVNRLHRATGISPAPSGGTAEARRRREGTPVGREGQAETAPDRGTDVIDPRMAVLRNWPGFKKK